MSQCKTHTPKHACSNTFTYACTHIRHTHIHTYKHVLTHSCMHTHTHMNTCTHHDTCTDAHTVFLLRVCHCDLPSASVRAEIILGHLLCLLHDYERQSLLVQFKLASKSQLILLPLPFKSSDHRD